MSARYYSSDGGTFISRDPLLHEKFISSYAYCLNNPLRFIDPDGRDEYETDGKGGFKRVAENIEKDIVRSKDKNGNEVNKIEFAAGTIEKLSSAKDGKDNYNIVRVRGDDQAQSLFEFLTTPENFGLKAGENVEWGRTLTGETGAKGLNFLTTEGKTYREGGSLYLFDNQLKNGYTIRGHDHNHNDNTINPSGLVDNKTGDISFMKHVKNNGNVTPNAQFRIFTPGNSTKYNTYNENSKWQISLPRIIVR
jgi:hypothetical protein